MKNMKNAFLGIFLVFGMSAFSQEGLVSSEAPNGKVIKTVKKYEKPVEVLKEVKPSETKTYAYLTRVVTTISEEEFNKRKALNY